MSTGRDYPIGSDASGDCEPIASSDRWQIGLVECAALAAFALVCWHVWGLVQLLDLETVLIALGAIITVRVVWCALGRLLGQSPIDYVVRGGPVGPHDHGGRS